MQKAETKLANTEIFFEKARGVAHGCRQRHETTYGEEYSLLYRGSILTSESTASTDFFLRLENGKERPLSFPFAIPIRDGHLISALYANAGGVGNMQPIALCNHTTDKSYILPLSSVYSRLGVAYPRSQAFAKWGCLTVIVALGFLIYLAILGKDSNFIVPLIALGLGGLVFTGYVSPKLDAAKYRANYLAEYDQLKSEVTHLFSEVQPTTTPAGPAT